MIYDIRHVTTYEYGSPVAYSLCALRLRPTSRPASACSTCEIDIDPPAAQRDAERICFFGNRFRHRHASRRSIAN